MAQHIQEVFWLTSADCQQLLYVSPAFETVWGRPRETLYTCPGGHLNLIVDSIHPSDRDRVVAALAEQSQNEYKQEYRIIRPDGSIRWVRSRAFAVQNPLGETWGFAGLSEDITERKRAEEILHQREQEFRVLVELSPDIIARFDRQLRHLYVNPAIELATGMPPQEFLGKNHRELGMPQDLLPLWEQSLQKVFQTVEADEHEFSFLTPHGPKYYQSRLVPELAADGSVASVLGICRDITKNKQTEELLRESEDRFRTVFEFAPIGIALTCTQGRFIASNHAFQEILGYTEQELQNQPFTQFTHPDDRADNFTLFQQMLAAKRTRVSREMRLYRKDGRLVWGKVSVSAIYDTNGSLQYAIAMLQDVSAQKQAHLELQQAHDELEKRVAERTAELAQANARLQQEIAERKQVQKALKAQKDFLTTLIDTNPNRIFVKDTQGKLVLANQAYADFYGVAVEDILGKTIAQLNLDQTDVERFVTQDQEVLTTLQPQFIPEEACQTPTGEMRWFQTIKKPLFSSDGQASHIFGVCTDITERKLAEEALRDSEQRYRLLVEQMNDGVMIVDENELVWYINEKLGEMLGYSPSEMIGHHTAEFLDETNLKIVQEQRIRHTRGESSSYELGLKKKDGPNLLTIASGTPILGTDGSFQGSFGIITDVTTLKAVESQLQQANEQLQAVLDAVPGPVSWISSEGRYLGVNQHLATSFNLPPNAFVGQKLGFLENSPDFVQFMEQFLASAAQTERQVIEVQVNGSTRYYLIAAQKYNQGTNAVSVGIDITERKQAEEAQRHSQALLQRLIDSNLIGVIFADFSGNITEANNTFLEMVGYTREDLRSGQVRWLDMTPPQYADDDARAREQIRLTGTCTPHEKEYIRKDGSLVPILTGSALLEGSEEDCVSFVLDLTLRKQAEKQIQDSLREKEVLLREIHHRVKNNLQVISSLLDLQSQYIEDRATLEMFRESCNRVRSMALVHEKLYQSKDCAKINFAEYIENLISYLFQAYGVNLDTIRLELNIDEVTLNINTAIPCGLIVSELVSNALKHAFPHNRKGTISVALYSELENSFTLLVRDNGVGFPQPLNISSFKTLGLQLVNVLTNQLDGTLEIALNSGTEVKVRFSELNP
jgi:PAS domain S-box-containing protein